MSRSQKAQLGFFILVILGDKMKVWIYPGSFDPFTLGHVNVAKRAAALCDKLIVSVMINKAKKGAFTIEERVEMTKKSLDNVPNIEVIHYDGLLVKLMKECGATAVVRGLRSESDYRYEAEMAAANSLLDPNYEAILFPCRPDLVFISSGIVREVASFGGDISSMVSENIVQEVCEKLRAKSTQ